MSGDSNPAALEAPLEATTALGAVRLTVADVERMQAFYERSVGLRPIGNSDGVRRLGVEGTCLVELVADPAAPARPRRTSGLFHLAILVPDRRSLAAALRRVAESGWRFSGASDHLVSEALYLDDPEGNGIEIYRDRPRSEWRYSEGTLEMATLPLDLQGVLGDLDEGDADDGMPAGTRIGHVHLNVSGLDEAERFYAGLLGFDVMVRGYPGALFVSAGGYHHHIGLNTWNRATSAPRPGARGLRSFTVAVSSGDLERIAERLRAAGYPHERRDGELLVDDPSGNRVVVTTAA